MRVVAVETTRATVELSIDELVLLMDTLWRELDAQAKRRGRHDEVLREMDTADDDSPGLA